MKEIDEDHMGKRLFIAIEIPDDIKEIISSNTADIKRFADKGSFERREKYHITLAFIGSTPEERIEDMKAVMERINCGPIHLAVDGISGFRGHKDMVLYQHVTAEKRLYNLQERLIKELKKAGFEPDIKKFTPHITLARRAVLKQSINPEELSSMTKKAEFTAHRMTIMSTEDGQYVPLYHRVFNE